MKSLSVPGDPKEISDFEVFFFVCNSLVAETYLMGSLLLSSGIIIPGARGGLAFFTPQLRCSNSRITIKDIQKTYIGHA